ncbi:Gfo/Idh/MocA family oxidoreductase [bacterium]|nr:Gfo/Idh/MocA family oxidoreductase [bacterium]
MKRSIAVIGMGYWGKNLVRVFDELGALRAVSDVNPAREAVVSQKYPEVRFCSLLEDVLSDEEIDGIVIATPASTHAELARRGLEAGKNVFVEKPLALSVEEGEELVSLADQSEKVLMVGHLLQYHPAVLKLKELICQGELGRIQYVYSNRLNMGKIRTEENILWSFAPHDISVIVELLEEEPKEVRSHGGSYLSSDVADVTVSDFVFPSGVRGHIFVSWLHPFKEQRLVVVGSKKMAVFEDTAENKLTLYPHKVEWINRSPTAVKGEGKVVPIEMREPLKVECEHFLGRIESHQPPRTDGREGLKVLRILDACQKSLETGGATIDLSVQRKAVEAEPLYLVHESSYVDEGCEIGEGTKIWHFSHIMSGARIGKNCSIGQNVNIGGRAVVGNHVKVQNNVSIYDEVTLEDEVFCGPSMVFTNVINPRSEIVRKDEYKPTLVKRGATLGANCTILCGNTIGKYAFVGAGAVVTKDVPDYVLVIGVPAQTVGWMCRCGAARLEFLSEGQASCKLCNRSYTKQGDSVTEE